MRKRKLPVSGLEAYKLGDPTVHIRRIDAAIRETPHELRPYVLMHVTVRNLREFTGGIALMVGEYDDRDFASDFVSMLREWEV